MSLRTPFVAALAALSLAGCATTPSDDAELGRESQSLYYTPIFLPIRILPPAWVEACPANGAVPNRFFVRRAGGCTDVGSGSERWVGTTIFAAPDHTMCSYRWLTATGSTPQYWALNDAAMLAHVNRTAYERTWTSPDDIPLRPDVRPDCMKLPTTCRVTALGTSSCPIASTAKPPLRREIPGQSPCGACGTMSSSGLVAIVPDPYQQIYIPQWNVVFNPNGSQVVVVNPPTGVSSPVGSQIEYERW